MSSDIEQDILWISEDPEITLNWKIDPVTGEYLGVLLDDEIIMAIENHSLPTHPPGFKYGLEHDDSNGQLDDKSLLETLHDQQLVESVEDLQLVEEPISDEIDQLTKLSADIKVVYSGNISNKKASTFPKESNIAHWAKPVDVNVLPKDYNVVVPEPPSFVHPFELDAFQRQAVYHIEKGESVFVAAHTSAGKTAIAEYAIGLCQKHLTRAIYTSPIKALSNQKFRDFRDTFGKDQVGLLTGDVQINPDAPSCLIMTTEILRSMLYRDSEMIREVEWVIFDEIHYVNDVERGVVWEEVIIMLPSYVKLVLLSATTPNTFEFADWIGRTRNEVVYVITTLFRPVPLEHHLYCHKEFFRIVDGTRQWNEINYKNALAKHQTLKSKQQQPFVGSSVLIELVYCLRKENLLPCVVFSFSRKRCKDFADALSSIDLNASSSDHAFVHQFLTTTIAKLSPADRDLPQLHRMKEMLKRGVAVHHSGLLPLMKEAVEMLFSRGLVKVLFATETFAMGVNMPARTVVFSGLKKHDGVSFRTLLAGEYTQMAGRAGRRGKDKVGTVVILSEGGADMPSSLMLQGLLLGQPTRLASQFRVTFGMILGLLRFESLQVEEMLKKSFSENASQKRRPEHEEQITKIEKMINDSPSMECTMCSDESMSVIADVAVKTRNLGTLLYRKLLSEHGHKYFEIGRIVVISDRLGGRPALIMKTFDNKLNVLTIPGQLSSTPFPIRLFSSKALLVPGHLLETIDVSPEHVVFVTTEKLPQVVQSPSDRQLLDIKQRFAAFIAANQSSFKELAMPRFRVLDLDEARLRRELMLSNDDPKWECPMFAQHFETYYNRASLVSRLVEVQFASSDNSLYLLPEYHARLTVLKSLQLVDEVSGVVLLKGRVACEIRTLENSVLLLAIELLFSGYLMRLRKEELAAMFSCLYFQERVDEAEDSLFSGLPDALVDACHHMDDLLQDLLSCQRQLGVQVEADERQLLRFGLVPVVYHWSLGHSFSRIALMTDVLEGTIVRCVVRLEEGLRELCHAAKIMGDSDLAAKFECAAVSIKRDICFASSLYI